MASSDSEEAENETPPQGVHTIRTIADNKVTLKERQEALAASSDIVSLLIKGVLKSKF